MYGGKYDLENFFFSCTGEGNDLENFSLLLLLLIYFIAKAGKKDPA